MYHPVSKNKHSFREALSKSYDSKCAYCNTHLPLRYMHVDHIIPSNPEGLSEEVSRYIKSLSDEGFILDSIENYLPTCQKCNRTKSNHQYTVTGLVFLHEEALRHVSSILSFMGQIEDDYDEEPISFMWDELIFSPQNTSIVNALLGSRLTQFDVKACPELPQVKKIIDRLELTNSVVIEGKPGSGKSISSYQAAYHFKKKGWHIYKLKAGFDEMASIPNVADNSLFLIDDAQNYSLESQNQWIDSARDNTKVIVSKTISDDTPIDSIIISNKDSIEVLKQSIIKDRDQTTKLVHKIDNDVGDHFGGIPIEWRIKETIHSKTPWEFNYILTGGWKRVKTQFEELREDNNSGLLACLIAVMQVLQKDRSINMDELNAYAKLSFDMNWKASVVSYLVSKRIVFALDDIRIIHIQSAYVIISIFINRSEKSDIEKLVKFVESYVIENNLSPLGLVWLFNGLLSYTYYPLEQLFLTEKILKHYFSNLERYCTSEERRDLAWLASKAIYKEMPINIRNIIVLNNNLMATWLYETDNLNAYAYSRLINDAINNKDLDVLTWISNLDWKRISSKIISLANVDYVSWGNLLNRLIYVYYYLKIPYPKASIICIIQNISEREPDNKISYYFYFFTHFAYTVPEYLYPLLENKIDYLESQFSRDTKQVFNVLNYDFLTDLCGMNYLDKPIPSNYQIAYSKKILSILPLSDISVYISKSYPGEWHFLKYFLGFVEYYDKTVFKTIGRLLDLDSLSDKASNCWDNIYEINDLLDILSAFSLKTAKSFLNINADNIQMTSPIMSIIDPRLMINLYRKGFIVSIINSNSGFRDDYYAIKRLYETDPISSASIIETNIDNIANKLNRGTALDFDDNYCLKLLSFISRITPEHFVSIKAKLDLKGIKTNWDRCGGLRSSSKTIKKRQKQYYEMIGIK